MDSRDGGLAVTLPGLGVWPGREPRRVDDPEKFGESGVIRGVGDRRLDLALGLLVPSGREIGLGEVQTAFGVIGLMPDEDFESVDRLSVLTPPVVIPPLLEPTICPGIVLPIATGEESAGDEEEDKSERNGARCEQSSHGYAAPVASDECRGHVWRQKK